MLRRSGNIITSNNRRRDSDCANPGRQHFIDIPQRNPRNRHRGYSNLRRNLSRVTLTSDNVFGDDGGIHQVATMSGGASAGSSTTDSMTV